MPITTNVPSNLRKPGTFHQFDVTSSARGLVPLTNRVALIGARTAAGTVATGIIKQIFTESEGDGYFGKGSELALMCRAALKAGKKYGASPEVFGLALADPGGGVKATRTFTVTGPATEAGDVVVTIAGRSIRAGVANGDTANTVAASINAAIAPMIADLPVTATVATNVVTLLLNNAGVNGNDCRIGVTKTPAGITIATASPIAGTGAYDITASLDLLIDRHYHAIAIANHTATDITDFTTHIDAQGQPGTKRWVFGVLAETASLTTGNTLGTTANKKEIIVGNAELFPNMTGEIAAQLATTLYAESDPALPFDGQELDLYLPPDANVPTDAEIETSLGAGTTILTVNDTKTATQIVRFVTTKTTEGGATFENLLDVTNTKSLFYIALQTDAAWKRWQANKRNKKNTGGAQKRLRSVTLDILKSAEDLEIVHNVDAHLKELVVETDAVVKTRLNVAIPVSVVPNLHQIVGVHTLFVEG